MDTLNVVLEWAKSATPLTIVAIQALTLFIVMVSRRKLHTMKTNDLHVLPEILAVMQRIEKEQAVGFAELKGMLHDSRRTTARRSSRTRR